jgi:curved DNA-binding protein CbpA
MYPVENVDYYAELGVRAGATSDEIRKVYRKLAKIHHPDVSLNDGMKMRAINRAHSILSQPVLRAQYDMLYHQRSDSPTQGPDDEDDTQVRQSDTGRTSVPRRRRRTPSPPPPPPPVSIWFFVGWPLVLLAGLYPSTIPGLAVAAIFAYHETEPQPWYFVPVVFSTSVFFAAWFLELRKRWRRYIYNRAYMQARSMAVETRDPSRGS